MENNTKNTGIIILAAGESKRLGRPKQLLKIQGKTLIERITKTSLETGLKTMVVLGANAEKIKPLIKNSDLKIVTNKNWQTGMSSSIVAGLKELLKAEKELSAVIILLADQPFISKETIFQLIKTRKEKEKAIVACEYENTLGVPAIFCRKIFEELLRLDKKTGAKSIIKKYLKTDVAKIAVPEAAFDIDTEEDFQKIKN